MSVFINLADIPDIGEDFTYDTLHTEMQSVLRDAIQGNDFLININILPAGGAYDAKGSIKTALPEVCSFCAKDFSFPVNIQFHEILMVGHKARTDLKGSESEFEDPELNLTELDGTQFNVGEFFRELILLAEPTQPVCQANCKGLCPQCGTDLNSEKCKCVASKQDSESKSSAFSVLKNLKLN